LPDPDFEGPQELIAENFGDDVASIVMEVTTIRAFPSPRGSSLLPREGDFLAVVGNGASRMLLGQITGILRKTDALPVVPVVLPSHVPGA
jgi:hypothetical protein